MFVLYVNFRSFGVTAVMGHWFCIGAFLGQEIIRQKTQPEAPSEATVKDYVKNLRRRDEEVILH